MNRKMFVGTFAIFALVAAVLFLNTVSANSFETKNDGSKKRATQSAAAPEASTTLVISQANGGGGGTTGTYQADYVELKNISSSPQSLAGLSIMYGSSTGQFGSSAGNIQALPSTTLQPGQYFLLQLGTVGAGGVPLPVTPDLTNTTTNMSGTSGKVALVTSAFTGNTCGGTATPCTLPNANIIDLVAYGVVNNAEGGAPTNGGAALTSSQGNVRKTGGCTDTDNNNADFDIITAPVPRNSGSTATPCGAVTPTHTYADFNGDGRTDWAITRNSGGLKTWWIQNNGAAGQTTVQWGVDTDQVVPADFDGDSKADIAIWREAPATQAAFYILQSSNSTFRLELFGQTGDRISSVGDYDGDGKADVSVYRAGASAGAQSYFFYRGSLSNPGGNVTYVPWGTFGDTQTSGDFDGDGKFDVCVRRDVGGQGVFILKRSGDLGVEYIYWGLSTDNIVPGDFDGDGKYDLAVARQVGANYNLYILERDGGGTGASPIVFALTAGNDWAAFGDFDGDGKQDIGIWREGNPGIFWVRQSSNSAVVNFVWGQTGDEPVYEWNLTGGV